MVPDSNKQTIIFIVAIIILVGVTIPFGIKTSNLIEEKYKENVQKYENAIVIEDQKKFEKYLNITENSYVLIKSPIKAVDKITNNDIDGEYMYLRIEFQKYVDDGCFDSNGNWVSDWKWKRKNVAEEQAKELEICGIMLPYNYFSKLPSSQQIQIVDTGYHTRCVYYGIPAEISGTSFAEIGNGSIKDENITFYQNKEPSQIIESKSDLNVKAIFWILWSMIMVAIIALLFYWIFVLL